MINIFKTKTIYFTTLLASLCLILLRIYDAAGYFTAIVIITGMTALIYSVRHACIKKEYLFIACMMSFSYAVRFYGYTGVITTDIILGILIGLIMFVIMAFERCFKKYQHYFLYTLITPTVYLLFMYFTETVKINMPFRIDPYISTLTVLCHISSILGIYFLDFLIVWTVSVIVFLIDYKKEKQSIVAIVSYCLILCMVIGLGIVHTNKMNTIENTKTNTIRISCATGPYIGEATDQTYKELSYKEEVVSLNGIVKDAAKKNTEILVFSEEAYAINDTKEDAFIKKTKQLSKQYNMHILLCYEVMDTDNDQSGKSVNKLCWISSTGKILYEYTKHCIVPFVETAQYVRGTTKIKPFKIEVNNQSYNVATAICYDADFDTFMSDMGKNVDLLLLPSWDWDVVEEEHLSVSRLRAIQSETTLVRCVYDGWNAVINCTGNILYKDNTNDIGYESVIVYEVPVS